MQSLFNIGILETSLIFLSFYRQVAHFIFAAPFELIGVVIPSLVVDFWTLSFVGATAYVQSKDIDKSRYYRQRSEKDLSLYWKIKIWFFFGISGLGLWVFLSSISPITYMNHMHDEPLDIAQNAAKNLFLICIATVVFFIINAFGPVLV